MIILSRCMLLLRRAAGNFDVGYHAAAPSGCRSAGNGRRSAHGTPTDPLFDREHVATDDPAFVLAAVESARQGVVDARNAARRARQRRNCAPRRKRFSAQNEATTRKLEQLAGAKGWRLPQPNPERTSTFADGAAPKGAGARPTRTSSSTRSRTTRTPLAQYRAQTGRAMATRI